MSVPAKSNFEVSRKSYSDEEIAHIYELARFHLENGAVKAAEAIFKGVCEVRSDFVPGWLGLAYVRIVNQDFDHALECARKACKAKPDSVEALLFQVTCLLSLDDLNGAGTLLGEVGEMIETGEVVSPNLMRFYKGQLARYQSVRMA